MQKVVAIVGPTASGKSSLGIYLAQKLGGEVISADSRQVYKGLNIGTGKVTKKEMAGIPHHLLSVVSPKKQFTVDDFYKLGTQAIQKTTIYRSLPIVVGGTGLYVDVLLGRMGYAQVPPNPTLRKQLEKRSLKQLFAQLKKLDPVRAKTVEPHHKRRLIRAIEIAQGQSKITLRDSESAVERDWRETQQILSNEFAVARRVDFAKPYQILWLGLNPKNLKQNISKRLKARMRAGMVAEARRLHKQGLSYKRMEELGLEYRYLAHLLQGKLTQKQFEEQLEREINRYAKRQWRWFKRNKEIRWVGSKAEALRLAKQFLKP